MKRLFVLLVIFTTLCFIQGCSSDSDPNQTGKLNVYLTDAPGDYGEVNITFSNLSAHIDSEWVNVQIEPVTVNLLDFNNAKLFLLGSSDLRAGHYTQIRFSIESAEVVVKGKSYLLNVPSEKLKLGPQFTINEGSTYELVLDFDVNRSVVENGNGSFKLKPHIRVVPKALTGSISGQILNFDDMPIAYAIQDGDTLTSAFPDSTGYFMLSYLAEGNYNISVKDTLSQLFNKSVDVTPGKDYSLEQITLK